MTKKWQFSYCLTGKTDEKNSSPSSEAEKSAYNAENEVRFIVCL